MKAVKIIGVILGSLAVLAGIGLLIVSFGIGQTLATEQQLLKRQHYAGPYPGTVLTETGSRSFRVDWTDQAGKTHKNQAYLFGATRPEIGERIEIWQAEDVTDGGLLISREPHLRDLAATVRLTGALVGGAGLLLLIGCVVALVVGRRRRLAAGPPDHPPNQPPTQRFPPQQGPVHQGPGHQGSGQQGPGQQGPGGPWTARPPAAPGGYSPIPGPSPWPNSGPRTGPPNGPSYEQRPPERF